MSLLTAIMFFSGVILGVLIGGFTKKCLSGSGSGVTGGGSDGSVPDDPENEHPAPE